MLKLSDIYMIIRQDSCCSGNVSSHDHFPDTHCETPAQDKLSNLSSGIWIVFREVLAAAATSSR